MPLPKADELAPVAQLLAYLRADAQAVIQPQGREVFIARAPGRLDVMGGIADYTGSLVCEMPLAEAAACALQQRDDHTLMIHSYNQTGAAGRFQMALGDFSGTASLLPLTDVRKLFTGANHWAGYVAGAYYILRKYRHLSPQALGANIAIYSTVPLGGGVSSSAALEVAALSAIVAAYHIVLDPLELAVLAQRVENEVVGAPCGVMDQVTSALGKENQLLLLHCQPHTIEGYSALPAGVTMLGINSGVKHSVGGSAYRDTRVAAFMAHGILLRLLKDLGVDHDPLQGYLANVPAEAYRQRIRALLPAEMRGQDYLDQYGPTVDKVTSVDPKRVYHVQAAADHHVLEAQRVRDFVALLRDGKAGSVEHLTQAGALMLAAHESYGNNAKLGCAETDLLVRLVMARGPKQGFYGAKITGGGSGGTVAVLCQDTPACAAVIAEIVKEYQQQTGIVPQVLRGSSPGATEVQVARYPSQALPG